MASSPSRASKNNDGSEALQPWSLESAGGGSVCVSEILGGSKWVQSEQNGPVAFWVSASRFFRGFCGFEGL